MKRASCKYPLPASASYRQKYPQYLHSIHAMHIYKQYSCDAYKNSIKTEIVRYFQAANNSIAKASLIVREWTILGDKDPIASDFIFQWQRLNIL